MKFIIGGAYQGKKKIALNKDNLLVIDGKDEVSLCEWKDKEVDVFLNLHLYIKQRLEKESNPFEEIKEFLHSHKEITIVCDEIGYGIVPMTRFDREYRELTGRIGCFIAEQSDEVIRVFCGIGRKIK